MEHAGTHLDAPIHFSENGATADRIDVASLVVPLAVVDVSEQAAKNADYQMTRADLEAYEKKHGRIPDNACVAMHSGWARYAADDAKFTGKDAAGAFHFPGVSPDAAQWLLTRAQGGGTRGRYAVARSRPVEGLQDALSLAAVGTMGAGECRRIWIRCRQRARRSSSVRRR